MKNYFAAPETVSASMLEGQIASVGRDPVIDALLKTVGGLFAVCNEFRQVLAVNNTLLEKMGLKDQSGILGLRPGEILGCKNPTKFRECCGSTPACSSCGAAIAMVTSLAENQPVEKVCAMSVERMGTTHDYYFLVRSTPVTVGDTKLILLLMQDITRQQQLESLERTFFHDISNTIMALRGLSTFARESESDELPDIIKAIEQATQRLASDVKFQRVLMATGGAPPEVNFKETDLKTVFEDTIELLSAHPATTGKKLRKPEVFVNRIIKTDKTILSRVLQNMLLNAFENSDPGRAIRFWVDCGRNEVTFCVWNHICIPEEMRRRIFQRNYTTKAEPGHGLGTYSIKLFGETFLGGKVSFETSEESGTVFRFCLPLIPEA